MVNFDIKILNVDGFFDIYVNLLNILGKFLYIDYWVRDCMLIEFWC